MEFVERMIAALEALANPEQPLGVVGALSADQRHRTVKTVMVRKLAKQFSNELALLPWNEQVRVVQALLDYGTDRVAHLGVFMLGLSIHQATTFDVATLGAMVDAFRGWSVTDAFCIEVLQPLLIRFTADALSMTERWSQSENLWKRRASVVIFARKIGGSGDFTRPGLTACERLIEDSEDLVRKGVGWALKDLMRGDREVVLEYVIGLRKRGVPSVISLYALRDIRGEERQRILAIREGRECHRPRS